MKSSSVALGKKPEHLKHSSVGPEDKYAGSELHFKDIERRKVFKVLDAK